MVRRGPLKASFQKTKKNSVVIYYKKTSIKSNTKDYIHKTIDSMDFKFRRLIVSKTLLNSAANKQSFDLVLF